MATPKNRAVVAVVGSLNIDFVTRTTRIPAAGETLAAKSFATGYGGKGANQAVAAARLADRDEVEVRMVGNVGDDNFGRDYIAALTDEGIKTTDVKQLAGEQTGVTNIIVDEATGENRILFVANANFNAFEAEQSAAWDIGPAEADVLVFQLEIPLDVVLHNLHLARERGRHTILNPAPAQLLPDFVYQDIDTLIMNETESAILAAQPKAFEDNPTDDSIFILARQFLHWGVREAVIITLGAAGLIYATAEGPQGRIAAHKVSVVDTTAAGDTFVGAYAVQRAKAAQGTFDIEAALEFATLAASKTVQKAGAMASIPRLSEL